MARNVASGTSAPDQFRRPAPARRTGSGSASCKLVPGATAGDSSPKDRGVGSLGGSRVMALATNAGSTGIAAAGDVPASAGKGTAGRSGAATPDDSPGVPEASK